MSPYSSQNGIPDRRRPLAKEEEEQLVIAIHEQLNLEKELELAKIN